MSSELSSIITFAISVIVQIIAAIDWVGITIALALLICIATLIYTIFPRKNFPEAFRSYCNTSFPPSDIILHTDQHIRLLEEHFKSTGPIYHLEEGRVTHAGVFFSGAAENAARLEKRPTLHFQRVILPIDIDAKDIPSERIGPQKSPQGKEFFIETPHFSKLFFDSTNTSAHNGPIIIRGARIILIEIDGDYLGHIYFENCTIASVSFRQAKAPPKVEVHFNNCWIGSMNFGEECCATLHIKDGGVESLSCPLPSSKPVITRSFFLSQNAILHGDNRSITDNEISGYRNFLAHIRNVAAPHTQQLVNATIFTVERKHDEGFLKLISYCYRVSSHYNTKSGLPLLWTLTLFITLVFLTYFLDLVAIPRTCVSPAEISKSWANSICQIDSSGRLHRSLGFSLNSYISPLSSLAENTLFKAKNLYFQFIGTAIGLLNLIWITLAIFSVKTRFTGKSSSQ